MRTIIYVNLLPFFLLFIFLILVLYNPVFHKKQERYFVLSTIVSMTMLVIVSLDYTFSTFEDTWFIRRITSLFNFAASPLIPFFIYKISNLKKVAYWFYLPLIINTVLCITSFFTGIIFYINSANQYDRGALFFIPFCCALFYMFMVVFYQGKRHTKGRNFERCFLLGVIAFLIIGMFLEIILHFYFLSWVAGSLSLPMYYLLLNINQSIIDPLTGAYTRAIYNKDLNRMKVRKNGVVALLDINDFKTVNDTLGHDAGDTYLINFTDVIQDHLLHCNVYRIGGDEFVIISKKDSIEKITQQIDSARKELNTKDIDFSYAIDLYQGENLDEFFNRIDLLMYEHKKQDKLAETYLHKEKAGANSLSN